MTKIVGVLLIILGVYMIYLGFLPTKMMRPPVVTGAGFLLIAAVFLRQDA
ncbi:MAG: putative Mn2+ efflux pump MntP [Roseivirga sp.]|jgi:putative Mn2+ efflux pump MntP